MPQPRTKAKTTDKDAALAYTFWRARCFRDGSPEEDSSSGGMCQLDQLEAGCRQITGEGPIFKTEEQMMLS